MNWRSLLNIFLICALHHFFLNSLIYESTDLKITSLLHYQIIVPYRNKTNQFVEIDVISLSTRSIIKTQPIDINQNSNAVQRPKHLKSTTRGARKIIHKIEIISQKNLRNSGIGIENNNSIVIN